MKKTNPLLVFMAMVLPVYFVPYSLNAHFDLLARVTSLYGQGFLSQDIKDILALLGALLVVEKIIRMIISSTNQGRIRNFYTQNLLPHLMSWTYAKGEVKAINNLLQQLSIGKLSSSNEEDRKTGIKQLGNMKPNEAIFKTLVRTLAREKSKHLRVEIVRTLVHHVNYKPN